MACSALVKLQSKSENGDMDDLAPEEAMVERLLERLETGIESAVSQERFKEASALRDEISRMHMDDSSAVLKVNSCMLACSKEASTDAGG
jgi:protein-arginine kinase activator protein McsA